MQALPEFGRAASTPPDICVCGDGGGGGVIMSNIMLVVVNGM